MNLAQAVAIFAFAAGATAVAGRASDPPPPAQPSNASVEAAPAPAKTGEIVESLKKAKATIAEADLESRRILGSLYAINRRMKKITREKSHLTDELFSAQGTAKGTARAIADLEAQIQEQKASLKKRLRALYKLSGQSYVAILFSQSSPADLDRALRGLKSISDQDYRLIRAYQRNVAARKEQRKKLKAQVERLVAIEKRIREQEGRLVAEHRAKTAFVSSLEASKAAEIARVQALRAKTHGLKAGDERIDGLLRASFFEQKGQLASPIPSGSLLRGFGAIRDERTRAQLSHKGWTIAAAKGVPIQAVYDGTVAHLGWIPGLGSVIVIDHGDHYYSVYAHAARARAKVGESVAKGQTIAEVGATSWRDGDGMYFEIRHFSDAEDPARWLREKGTRLSSAGKGGADERAVSDERESPAALAESLDETAESARSPAKDREGEGRRASASGLAPVRE